MYVYRVAKEQEEVRETDGRKRGMEGDGGAREGGEGSSPKLESWKASDQVRQGKYGVGKVRY
jgi:hypothetical protein